MATPSERVGRGMEITGVDTLLVVPFDARPAVAAFLDALRRSWPAAAVSLDDGAGQVVTDLGDAAAFPDRGELAVARDARMDQHWEEHGYAPMADGAGPVALFYHCHRRLVVDVDVLGANGLEAGPLSGWTGVELVLPEATALTLVTHAEPVEDAFCRSVLELLREALGYRREQ
ncbi:hypothetical protein [Micromonospora musae]|uniref:hypothetical protein n=1 Tax=Micromonospora musae TaxID=1894970 RepID=UPI00341F91F1